MKQEYFEILIEPYQCAEVFLDFIVHNIQSCIEELWTPYHLEDHNAKLASFDLTQFFPKEQQKFYQIVIRTQSEPMEILKMLKDFAKTLSLRMEEEVAFGFGYRICQNKDWIEAYRQSILPVVAGGFYIRPSWHLQGADDLRDIVIDPALAFGSGHHATTSMCLEFLSKMSLSGKRLLDVGCGSGILSIASAMLGAEVEICDTDELAIQESEKNFALNSQVFQKSWLGSIAQAQGDYEVIVANIVASILVMLQKDFGSKLKRGGILILSGILDEYRDWVLENFRDFETEQILKKDEWVALKLIKV